MKKLTKIAAAAAALCLGAALALANEMDVLALGALQAARERGLRVPEDLSLVGYDNVSYAAIPRIHLTTVSQHKFQQGRIAVERLLCQIQGDRRPTADLLQPELVVRSTCAPRTQGGRTL